MTGGLAEDYRRVPPLVLYRQLLAGDPEQVERVAAAWDVVASCVRSIAEDLAADLDAMSQGWAGTGAHAYRERVAVLVAWALRLADDADAMRTGLTVMAAALTNAARTAESPPSDDDDIEPAIGVLGPGFGRLLSPAVRDGLGQRLAQIVAALAQEYAVAEHAFWHGSRPVPSPDPQPLAQSPTTDLAAREEAPVPATVGTAGAAATTGGAFAPIAMADPLGSAARSGLSTMAGAGAAQPAGTLPTPLVAPTSIDASPGAQPMAMPPPMFGGAAGHTSTAEQGEGRRWRDDTTALDPDSIAWAEQSEQAGQAGQAGQPLSSTLADSAWRKP